MASTYLSKTFGSAGSSTTWTLSFWVKKVSNGIEQRIFSCDDDASGNNDQWFKFDSADIIQFSQYQSGYTQKIETNRKFRDTNGFYHIVLVWDTTNGTAGDRTRLYVNGVRETSFSSEVQASSSLGSLINNTTYPFEIGRRGLNGSQFFDGVLSHVHFCDGTALAPTVFGETDTTTGEWKIKTSPSFTLGTNGFTILKDGNTITDQSTNSNDFSLAAGTLTKTEDCPSNVFCTMNPLTQEHTGSTIGYSSGNTNIFFDQTGQWWHTTSTLGAITGKYYAECKIDAVGGECSLGIISSDTACLNQGTGDYMGKEVDSIGYLNDGRTFKANSAQETGLTSLSSGSVVGIAMDLDNNTVQFYVNGASTGNAVSLTADKFYLFGCSGYSDTRFYWNFGNGYFNTTAISSEGTNASNIGKFEYDVPANHTALSTKGLNE